MGLYILNYRQGVLLEHQDWRIDKTVLQMSRNSTIEVQIVSFRSIFMLSLFYGLFSAANEAKCPFSCWDHEKRGLSDYMEARKIQLMIFMYIFFGTIQSARLVRIASRSFEVAGLFGNCSYFT